MTKPMPLTYHSVKSVLADLNNYKDEQSVHHLLKLYDDSKKYNEEQKQLNPSRKHPLIVFEGLDACGKTTLSKKVSNKRRATLKVTPPSVVSKLRSSFDANLHFRNLFYSLSNYIAANYIEIDLYTKAVVLDRFWHSTATYSLAQEIHSNPEFIELPAKDDSVYEWPTDLLQPDIVLYLRVSETQRLKRISNRPFKTAQESLLEDSESFRKNIDEAYKRMRSPGVTIINSDPYPNVVCRNILEKTEYLFAT